MRALEKFKKEKGFTYKKLYEYLKKNGVNISFQGVYCWCTDAHFKTSIDPKHVPKLVQITGYDFADFYRDIP